MSVTNPDYTSPYNGDGSNNKFDYGFPITDKSQLLVTKTSTLGVDSPLTVDTDYTVSGVADTEKANWYITYPVTGTKLQVGEKLTIVPFVLATQETNFDNQGNNYSKAFEDGLDKLTVAVGQLLAITDRCVKVQIGSTTDPDDLLTELSGDVASAAASAATATTEAGIATTQAAASSVSAAAALVSANNAAASAASITPSLYVQKANNLSDLASATTARTNLGLGTAAILNVGTGNNNIVQLNGSAKLPAVDGSLLTNLPSSTPSTLPTGFTSSQQTVTFGATLTVAHGLGSTPRLSRAQLVCITTDLNYAVGDVINNISVGDANNIGATVSSNVTNVIIKVTGNGIYLSDSGAGYVNSVITASKWKFVIQAWL